MHVHHVQIHVGLHIYTEYLSLNLWHSTQTTTNGGNCEGLRTVFARLHHACLRAPWHMLHFFFLSFSAMLISPPYLKCISINLDHITAVAVPRTPGPAPRIHSVPAARAEVVPVFILEMHFFTKISCVV